MQIPMVRATGVEIKIVDEDRNTLPAGHEGAKKPRAAERFMGIPDEPELSRPRTGYNDGITAATRRMDEDGYIKITGRKSMLLRWR